VDVLGPGNYRRIAREAGCAHQHVMRVLQGRSGVSLEVVRRIAEAAGEGVTVEEVALFAEWWKRYKTGPLD
jgi:transcriptional regulator with XRE-family HTH domain